MLHPMGGDGRGVVAGGAVNGRHRHRVAARLLCGLLAGLLFVTGCQGGKHNGGAAAAARAPSPRVRAENAQRGSTGWQSPELESYRPVASASGELRPPRSTPPPGATAAPGSSTAAAGCGEDCWGDTPIRGYASATSVNRGQPITLFVSTAQPSYRIEVYRMGWYGGSGARLLSSVANLPGQNQPLPAPDPQTGEIAADWQPSYVLQTGSDWASGIYLVKLVAADGSAGYLTFVLRDDVSTAPILYVVAITTYQAYNNWGGKSLYAFNSSGPPAVKASFDRPYADWDGAGPFFDGDFSLVRFLERNSYDLTYATSIDLHADPNLLRGRRVFISPWHDEYWSREMRAHLTAARDAGTSLAFFDANAIYWQIRFESAASGAPDRVIVCYRSSAKDPAAASSPATATVQWRQAPVDAPENGLLGAMFSSNFPNGQSYPWVARNTGHWLFAGTGLKDGESIAGLVGYEYDRAFNNGFTPRDLALLSASPVKDGDGSPDLQNSTIYTACSGALVFDAGTIYWALRLDENSIETRGVDTRVQRMTSNLLQHMLDVHAHPGASCPPQPTPTPVPPGPLHIFGEALDGGWLNASFNATVDFGATAQAHGGAKAIALTVTKPYGALGLYTAALVDPARYPTLHLWARASAAGQSYAIAALDRDDELQPFTPLASFGGDLSPDAWKEYVVPL
ncbi:MAG TPA: N,N-dimethylformamidase beta subunit family domain-containing protein, partial [Dehalococcoidia bacterium]|nr:N,N-dimethylformamidase beta subunit family domain-containing protein [Dehalococcoidia bacterium]